MKITLLLILAISFAAGPARAAERLLAAETAAETTGDSFVMQGSTWFYPYDAVPETVLPGWAKERIVWFDTGAVNLLFTGADPKIPYEIELSFYSDGKGRSVRVSAGGRELIARLDLPEEEMITRRVAIPAEAVNKDRIEIGISRLAGPNAILSSFKLLSPDPAAKALKPFSVPAVPLPTLRLSPRPERVDGVSTVSISLNGKWDFNPAPPGEFWKNRPATGGWQPITVPGEWTMQGFTVAMGQGAAYRRAFSVPADWAGRRVKIRFDAVYAEARVWVNGRAAGEHKGGFTPFELDVTGLVHAGKDNELAIEVRSLGTKPDSLASGSQYAQHDLGGIPRKVTLFALPQVNLAALHVTTELNKNFTGATLKLALKLANEATTRSGELRADCALFTPDGTPVKLETGGLSVAAMDSSTTLERELAIAVENPLLWDNEHPRLYRLACTLSAGGRRLETVSLPVGFRQVEVRGNQLLLNGRAVKLAGVCRHETHPTLGRALTPELWEKDARMFVEGNVNYVRTSHYPPAEEFLEWCDRLGLLVESEAPFCWAHRTALAPAEVSAYVVRPALEMVEFNRNHPSVIIWSIGNESQKWREYFSHSAAAVKAADPTRPRNFSGTKDTENLEIAGPHYPGFAGPAKYADAPRPTVIDEYIHLNCYNRLELAADPGVRDFWGLGSDRMWNLMRASQGTLGGAIWAALDDAFFLPDGRVVGYGTWGPIDGWRRAKPEYWHMKKVYSPLRIAERPLPVPGPSDMPSVSIENRHAFTDLSEIMFEWALCGRTGSFKGEGAPGTTATLVIPLRASDVSAQSLAGNRLNLKARGPRGFVIDQWSLPIGEEPAPVAPVSAAPATPLNMENGPDHISVRSADFNLIADKRTGLIRAGRVNGNDLIVSGPALMILPLKPPAGQQFGGSDKVEPFTPCCADWKTESVTGSDEDHEIQIKIAGRSREAEGSFTLRPQAACRLKIEYDFKVKQKIQPRQIGLVIEVPRSCDNLFWRRDAYWSCYPEDHIGRPSGFATPFAKGVSLTGLAGPSRQPSWPWSLDANALGCHDFRSTKLNVREAGLRDGSGAGVRVISDGSQHVRAWVDGEKIKLLVADYANEGAERFFKEHVTPERPLAPGDRVRGAATIELTGN